MEKIRYFLICAICTLGVTLPLYEAPEIRYLFFWIIFFTAAIGSKFLVMSPPLSFLKVKLLAAFNCVKF